MHPEITFRLLTADDAEITRELRLRACREEPEAFLEAYEELVELTLEDFRKRFGNGWIAGAFINGKLVGKAGLYRHKGLKVQHKGTVWGVYAAPEARGRGIARGCIEMVLAEAKQKGIEHALLSVTITNTAARNVYESLGFESYGVEKRIMKVDGRYIDDALMIKFLT